MVKEEGKKGAAILEERRGPPPAKEKMEEKSIRPYFQTLDGSLVFDVRQLPEVNEGYRGYLTR